MKRPMEGRPETQAGGGSLRTRRPCAHHPGAGSPTMPVRDRVREDASMEWLIFWAIMAGVVAMVANSKGRSAALWFGYGLLIWPIALTHALLLKREE
jgi:hypothetical protein